MGTVSPLPQKIKPVILVQSVLAKQYDRVPFVEEKRKKNGAEEVESNQNKQVDFSI